MHQKIPYVVGFDDSMGEHEQELALGASKVVGRRCLEVVHMHPEAEAAGALASARLLAQADLFPGHVLAVAG